VYAYTDEDGLASDSRQNGVLHILENTNATSNIERHVPVSFCCGAL